MEPFAIYQVTGFQGGTVAICRQPMTLAEIDIVSDWVPDIVVTHTTEAEFPTDLFLPIEFQKRSFEWMFVPIFDFGAPVGDTAKVWEQAAQDLSLRLSQGARILCHCKGGQGRSGMMALRLLVEQGEEPNAALERLRSVRAGAVETDDQFAWASKAL